MKHLKSNYSDFEADFVPVRLAFVDTVFTDVFGEKNNKTLAQTLAHRRYKALGREVARRFPNEGSTPLGDFLLELKHRADPFYKEFLNDDGDRTYCEFEISDECYLDRKGIYAYYDGSELSYIGRCCDSMRKRINQGYGKIAPKNCFRDGQSTNCHLNAEILGVRGGVSLWFHEMASISRIKSEEINLLRTYRPPWNKKIPWGGERI